MMNTIIVPKSLMELRKMDVALPREPHREESDCPVPRAKVQDYLAWEVYGYPEARARIILRYARHARLGKTDHWLWFFTDNQRQEECYAIVSDKPGRFLGLTLTARGWVRGLSADQIILGEYAKVMSGPKAVELERPPAVRVTTGIKIEIVKSWGLRLRDFVVLIDDRAYEATPGVNEYPLEPGEHAIHVYGHTFLGIEAGRWGPVFVNVEAGSVTRLVYHRTLKNSLRGGPSIVLEEMPNRSKDPDEALDA